MFMVYVGSMGENTTDQIIPTAGTGMIALVGIPPYEIIIYNLHIMQICVSSICN